MFASTRFVEYTCILDIGIIGTYRPNTRVIQELLNPKKGDSDDYIPWRETHLIPIESGRVCHIDWKDNTFVLMISSVISGDQKVKRLRKRPKETSSKAKTARAIFGNKSTKELEIPAIADEYNYHIGAMDEFDHMTA
jgi:hypothetical protein